MRTTLATVIALALSGFLLGACDRPADSGRAASGGSATQGQAATGGTPKEKQQDPRTTPKQPSGPSGSK